MTDARKRNILSVVILTVICIVVAAVLAAVNMLAEPKIEAAEAEKRAESLKIAMPDGEFNPDPDELKDGAPETVKEVYTDKLGGGHVVILSTNKGYTGNEIGITVGIGTDGKIIKAVITKNDESIVPPDLKPFGSYGDKYAGSGADEAVDLVTGATVKYTENAIKAALYDAFVYLGYADGSIDAAPDESPEEPEITVPKEESEIEEAAKALSGATSLSDITPSYNKPRTLIKLYFIEEARSYVAYIVVPGDYVPVATEMLLHVDKDCNIVDAELLTWIVGHGVDPGNFADNFIGKDTWSTDEVELVSGATGTSADLLSAVDETMKVIAGLAERSEEKLLMLSAELLSYKKEIVKTDIPEGAPEYLRSLYKVGSNDGYVAYVVVPGDYVAVATEALIYFDSLGRISNINLMTWNVGHGVSEGDFAKGFIGKTEKTVSETELVAAATGTSLDFRDAVVDIYPYIPTNSIYRIIAIIAVSLSVIAFASYHVIINRKRGCRREG